MSRVALVHDWLTGLRGGERVLQAICEMYPAANIFTLVHVRGSCGPIIESRPISTSFLQRLPGAERRYRHFLPLFPLAIESLDLRGYDLVISTSHAVAKGCKPANGARHVAYIHTPMRYVWDQFEAYFGPGRAGPITRLAAHLVAPSLRRWDVRSTARAHALIANSHFVSDRMRRVWGRAADAVIHPPVETSRFQPARDLTREERGSSGYALIVSALVPYKRIELAVRAFTRLGRRLLVAGDGPELGRLQREAGPSIQFLGAIAHDELPQLYARASFFLLPGEEDFGIAPVEAQAAGRPVLALGRGGALETVLPGKTGLFFDELSVESLLEGVRAMDAFAPGADPDLIHANAERFAAPRFTSEMRQALARFA
ncbi:MAG TPA: glycosyltransferase [Gemmatimonadales bacterium]|nr:glycosyltransferase [Gemmatimonadales bacterium]